MEFNQFNTQIQKQFDRMCESGKLFRSSVSGSKVWETYLSSFAPENNSKFRDPQSSEHNCNCCHNFIRRYGNIVAIIDNKLESIFNNIDNVDEYTDSSKACAILLSSNPIKDVFFETYLELDKNLNYEKVSKSQTTFKLGVVSNHKQYTQEEVDKFGVVNTAKVYTFEHFNINLPSKFVSQTSQSIEQIMALYRDKFSVFKRAIEEIPLDTLILVKDLINQGSLLDGQSHLHAVNNMIQHHQLFKMYDHLITDLDFWNISYTLTETEAKFKNHLIGVLCTELAEGKELNDACKAWNIRVDPINYNKAKAPITEAQKKLAQQFVIDNGYLESFNRRLATIDDIKASEILHKNVDNTKAKAITIFDSVKTSGTGRYKRSEFDKIETISIDKFMSDILPSTTNIELLLENKFEGNLVNLTTIVDSEAKQIFKWDNPFSYTFNGNLAGKSQLAQMVESKGGRVDGAFRFTHSWNNLEPNQSLMDLHVFMPGCEIPISGHHGPNVTGRRVGWNNRTDKLSGGIQDVDYTSAAPTGYIPVENITFPDINKMPDGVYTCAINNWSFRQTGGKGEAEIAFNGELFQYTYPSTKLNDWVIIAKVTLNKGVFTIEHHLPETTSSRKLWNLDTNEFHKVNLVSTTPNHWGDNNVGNKHYLFMLQDCKNSNQVRGFHNEHLISDLLQHRKVLDVLGNSAMIEPTNNQLAGVGFNATVKEEFILRLSGSHKRVIKVTI